MSEQSNRDHDSTPRMRDDDVAAQPGNWQDVLAHYDIVEEIACGGMGQVLRARDRVFGRAIAIKVLSTVCCDMAGAAERFAAEARLTGQLQHPGIPPVHEVGNLQDGRPFFSMKLIEGRTLSDLLRERASPQADLPKYLKMFEQVTQTIAYAHSMRVIHRDLKPQNVMIGRFGEVMVMDWGLAKQLNATSPPSTHRAAPLSESSAHFTGDLAETLVWDGDTPAEYTAAGAIMGTRPYMAPEQARGQTEQIDQRSDVFGLGAILCVILTGAPPYRPERGEDLLRLASEGDLADAYARLEECGGDEGIVALAKQCLSASRDERPADAGVVANQVAAYLDSIQMRLKRAEIEQAKAVAKALEERKRRRLALALMTSLLLLVTVSAGSLLWFSYDRAQKAQAEAEAQAIASLRKATAERDVESELVQAERLQRLIDAQLVDDNIFGLLNRPDAWRADIEAALAAVGRAQTVLKSSGEVDPALASRCRALVEALQTDMREHLLVARLEKIREDAALLTDGKWDTTAAVHKIRQEFDEAGFQVITGEVKDTAERIARSKIRPLLVAALDSWAHWQNEPQERERVLEIARQADPDPWRDRLRTPANWGKRKTLEELAQDPAVGRQSPHMILLLVELLRNVRFDTRPMLMRLQADYPSDYWANFRLARTLHDAPEAVGYYRAALAIRPDSAVAYNNLAAVLRDQGDLDAAMAALERALALEPKQAIARTNVGSILFQRGDAAAAMMAHRQAIADDPECALAHLNIGHCLQEQGEFDAAKAAIEESLRLDPKSADAHSLMARIFLGLDDVAGAIASSRQSLKLEPNNLPALETLGMGLHRQGNYKGAIAAYRSAVKVAPKNAHMHVSLADAYRAQGDFQAAVFVYRQAIALDPKQEEAHIGLGEALRQLEDYPRAIASYKAALSLNPTNVQTLTNLGGTLYRAEDYEAAIATLRNATDLDPNAAEAHFNLGSALLRSGMFVEALANFQKAQELGSRQENWTLPATEWTKIAQRMIKLDETLPSIVKRETVLTTAPENAQYGGFCLHYKQRYETAYELFTAAFALDPKLAERFEESHRYNAACAAVLSAGGKGIDKREFSDEQRAERRKQALDWLTADIRAWQEFAKQDTSHRVKAREYFHACQKDPKLASVRDRASLLALQADERVAWMVYWAEVQSLLDAPANP